jgi:hypothetical protein
MCGRLKLRGWFRSPSCHFSHNWARINHFISPFSHFHPNTLSVGSFGHGDGKTLRSLPDNDVVLTTYHTLAADWKGKRILQQLTWFRVVLDEGKLITFNPPVPCSLNLYASLGRTRLKA